MKEHSEPMLTSFHTSPDGTYCFLLLLWNIFPRDFRTMPSSPDIVATHFTSWQHYAVLYCYMLQRNIVRLICTAKRHTPMFPALFHVSQRLCTLPSALSKHPLSLCL